MSDITIFGPAQSSYVRTARFCANEKGITHELSAVGDDPEALHPYRKFPAMDHDGFKLFETAAICQYIDSAFDGPALVPADPKGRALMDQWISVIDCYFYDHAIRNYALKYIFAGESGPDRNVIDATVPKLEKDLALLDRAYGDRGFIVGDGFTLADAFVTPIVHTILNFPEAQAITAKLHNLMRGYEQTKSREGYQKVAG